MKGISMMIGIFTLCLILTGSLTLEGGDAWTILKPGEPGTVLMYDQTKEAWIWVVYSRIKFHCPLCGEKGNRLGWIAIGKEVTLENLEFTIGAYLTSKDLYACPKCHLLFWEETRK